MSNEVCSECHARREERHPTFRFFEPRFDEARAAVDPEHCTSCHAEHTGRRVTCEVTICKHCHQDTTLKKDPVTPSHASLIHDEAWQTCLGCHDFHGNHVMTTPTDPSRSFSLMAVEDYFDGGASPYPSAKRDPARTRNQP